MRPGHSIVMKRLVDDNRRGFGAQGPRRGSFIQGSDDAKRRQKRSSECHEEDSDHRVRTGRSNN
jgi:hypothetical protein